MTDGWIVIRKERGYTSHDVVAKLRGILRMKKIGHTGTLDPAAEGVLPVALGAGTRLIFLLEEKVKTYEAVLRLGVTTDTQDMTGTVLEEKEVLVSEEEIRNAAESFVGEGMQIPPMYSAVKVNGKKLYELAREGKTVERAARPVTFHEIEVLGTELPLVKLRVTCSKGTYIRTLCSDIGDRLGCGGCMESLLRTRSGDFVIEDSHTLAEVEEAVRSGTVGGMILPVTEILRKYPELRTGAPSDRLLLNGNALKEEMVEGSCREDLVRMCTSEGRFLGLYRWEEEREAYIPVRMFPGLS